MSPLPKISVVIPSYNKGLYIEETINSIVTQNYPSIELIIQDGGSSDESVKIIEKFARKYSYIKWVSKKDNGQVDAINKGLAKSKGGILFYINADDVLSPGALEAVADAYLRHPQALWITGYGNIINNKSEVYSSWVTKYKNFLINLNNYTLLLIVNYLTQPATFITRKAYEKFGDFTGTRKYVLEYDYWLKLGKIEMPVVIKKKYC